MIFKQQFPIILASSSPRRKELLEQIKVSFEVLPIDIDESVLAGEDAESYVLRMARSKAEHAWTGPAVSQLKDTQRRALMSADTCVVLDGQILGKPIDQEDAVAMLSKLSGNHHQVITAVALHNAKGLQVIRSISEVTFARLSMREISDYCRSGEGMDKAGGYAIQGVAAQFVTAINGSYSGVVGLPLYETSQLLKAHFEEDL